MEYYFNNLNPTSFQRLINGILTARFGESIRLTPLRGKDGGRDAETAPGNPFWGINVNKNVSNLQLPNPQKGRYLFQIKHHRTIDARISDVRNAVINDFETELKRNVLTRTGEESINFFFLITNVPCSRDSLINLDLKRKKLLKGFENLHADIWWQEQVISYLDQLPQLWHGFPEMFPGGKPPFLADLTNNSQDNLSKSIRLALETQYKRESIVKFRQIELDKSLSKLFIDLDVNPLYLKYDLIRQSFSGDLNNERVENSEPPILVNNGYGLAVITNPPKISALSVLMDESSDAPRKIILEGGPGQGKSTITQMVSQIYRNKILKKNDLDPEGRWKEPSKIRVPFRIELRNFAEWLIQNNNSSLEKYISYILTEDSGGNDISAKDIQNIIESCPSIIICDGLDEVGSDDLRDVVLNKISECVDRLVNTLKSDLKVIITTRPPAIVGRIALIPEFTEVPLTPLSNKSIGNYLKRWLLYQVPDIIDKENVRNSFERRRNELHVKALAQNPMQLSVLLHFIKLKGEAFPDRRAELYKEYFKTVVDRDVEKSSKLLKHRDIVENLHQWLGYKIHSLTEAELADGTLKREQLLKIVQEWLTDQGDSKRSADELFSIGEERLGLIVALRGEGEKTRYGFEVQPIREYFAASFINDQIRGNAHDIYQNLLQRNYWKEVALFLAGLRRTNEKADLISRAKEVDTEYENGWRQDGRAITLQLLQEGVFSYPSNISSDALNFLIDILDPSIVKVANEPKGILDSIPKLINQLQSLTPKERILEITKQQKNRGDSYTIYRLYKVLSQILEVNQFQEEVLKFSSKKFNFKEELRILWASSWGININKLSQKTQFWNDVNDDKMAMYWWDAAQNNRNAAFLDAPISYHPKLVEQYAINPISIFEVFKREEFELSYNLPKWAIWKLTSYQQLLAAVSSLHNIEELQKVSFTDEPNSTDYDGLDEHIKVVLKQLNTTLHTMLATILTGTKETINVIQDYIKVLIEYLNKPGLVSWIALRSALNLFEVKLSLMHSEPQYKSSLRSFNSVQYYIMEGLRSKEARMLWGEVYSFYSHKQLTSLSNIERLLTSEIYGDYHNVHFSFSNSGQFNYLPLRLRIEEETDLLDIGKFIFEKNCNQKPFPFHWMERIPWTLRTIRPIIEESRLCITNTLRYLGSITYNLYSLKSSFKPLLVQDTQRILKVVRLSDEKEVHLGALIALSTSSFLNIADEEDILKMIKASSSQAFIANSLFNSHNESRYFKTGLPNSKLLKVAKKIIENHEIFSTNICAIAATYLATHRPNKLPSLLTLELELGLHI